MFSKEKQFWLGEVAENLHKQVAKMETNKTPSTPLEVLEDRQKVVNEIVQKIQEAKALCAKAYEHVSQSC